MGSDQTSNQVVTKEQEEKKFGRRCPLFADVLILITQLLLAACFIYFAYFYNPINEISCFAAYGSTELVTISDSQDTSDCTTQKCKN